LGFLLGGELRLAQPPLRSSGLHLGLEVFVGLVGLGSEALLPELGFSLDLLLRPS
jgi:hypothetical protein